MLATSCEELTHWKRLWCWEGLGTGGEGDNRGWDGWMASPTRWTWVWVISGSWWWIGKPVMLQSMGLQRVGHDWVTELKVNHCRCFQHLKEITRDRGLHIFWWPHDYFISFRIKKTHILILSKAQMITLDSWGFSPANDRKQMAAVMVSCRPRTSSGHLPLLTPVLH